MQKLYLIFAVIIMVACQSEPKLELIYDENGLPEGCQFINNQRVTKHLQVDSIKERSGTSICAKTLYNEGKRVGEIRIRVQKDQQLNRKSIADRIDKISFVDDFPTPATYRDLPNLKTLSFDVDSFSFDLYIVDQGIKTDIKKQSIAIGKEIHALFENN